MKDRRFYYLSENCCFDRQNGQITDANRQIKHQLTNLQFKVLNYLINNQNNTLEYDQIMANNWDFASLPLQRNLADVICQLRKIDVALKKCIITHRKIGFSFRCDYPQPTQDPSDVHIVSSLELEKYGYTPSSAAIKLMANDFEIFGDLGKTENQGEARQWAAFITAYPETFYCAFDDNNELVGNWSFCIPQSEQLSLIKNGQVKEACFNLKNMDSANFLDPHPCYEGFLLNFSLNRSHRTMRNVNSLFDSFADQLLAWALGGVFFQSIYVNVFVEDQERMYQNMGFVRLCPNQPRGTIYHLNMIDFEWSGRWAQHPQLQSIYRDYFSKSRGV